MTRFAPLFVLLLALAACSRDPEPAAATAPSESASASKSEAAAPSAAPLAADIPAAVRGRWGLVPEDCTSTRGDAKGLMVVDATHLKFYESRAVLTSIKERSDSRLRAAFAFTGEGQNWALDITLDAQDGGRALVRRDYGADAMPGPLKYSRCPG